MADIVAPSSPGSPAFVCKGLRGANGTEKYIFGYPLPNYLDVSDLTVPWTLLDETTLFDVSSLSENHEVVVIGTNVTGAHITSSVSWTVTWYRNRDNAVVFQLTRSMSGPPEGQYFSAFSTAAWIGWLAEYVPVSTYPLYKEIQENGYYHATISFSGGYSGYYTYDFAVKGIPAKTVVKVTSSTSFNYTVRLSNLFDSDNYDEVGICSEPFTSGSYTRPSGILDYTSAPSSNEGCAVDGTVYEAVETVYGYAKTTDGRYWAAGSGVNTGMVTRPWDWEWYAPKTQGQDFYVSALEWRDFCDRINEFKVYKSQSQYGFTYVDSDDPFYYYIFNEARNCVAQMTSTTVPTVSSNDEIYAWYFNTLRDNLNAIP